MSAPHDWATSVVHDGPTEHWRVTGLLAKDARDLWQRLFEIHQDLPEDILATMRQLRDRLELTDYFLSGLKEGSSK